MRSAITRAAVATLLITSLCMHASSQEDPLATREIPGHYEMVELSNGLVIRKFVPHEPEDMERLADGMNRRVAEQYRIDGTLELLSGIDLNALPGKAEVLDYQKRELEVILPEFRSQLAAAGDNRTLQNRVIARHGKRIAALLLPGQLETLLRSNRSPRLLFSRLQNEEVQEHLSITKQQQTQLADRCDQLNDEIKEFVREIEAKQAALRKKAKEIYGESLSDEQRALLARFLDADGTIDKMSIEELEYDTRPIDE